MGELSLVHVEFGLGGIQVEMPKQAAEYTDLQFKTEAAFKVEIWASKSWLCLAVMIEREGKRRMVGGE